MPAPIPKKCIIKYFGMADEMDTVFIMQRKIGRKIDETENNIFFKITMICQC